MLFCVDFENRCLHGTSNHENMIIFSPVTIEIQNRNGRLDMLRIKGERESESERERERERERENPNS